LWFSNFTEIAVNPSRKSSPEISNFSLSNIQKHPHISLTISLDLF
jgi:hypothetical protein